jgi:hypothetical protein
MTSQQTKATQQAILRHVTIAAKGTIKKTGVRFYIVNSSHTAGTTYVVTVGRDRLTCTCKAATYHQDVVCVHRACVHTLLSAEAFAHTTAVRAARAARRETSMPAVSNKPVSIWK